MEKTTMICCALLIVAGQGASAWWVVRHMNGVSEGTAEAIEQIAEQIERNTANLQDSLDELAPKTRADRRDRELAPYR